MTELKPLLALAAEGTPLSEAEAQSAFDIMMSGDATPGQIGGFLMALRVRGESVDEITGAVRAMRAKMLRVAAPDDAIDVVGTGGDAAQTYNISTVAALVVASRESFCTVMGAVGGLSSPDAVEMATNAMV